LGHLFKGTSESSTKTELIIMLTPKIFSSVDELVKTTEELKKEFQKIK
jgi:type II secretory pathway component GspD/PulD (secretin)